MKVDVKVQSTGAVLTGEVRRIAQEATVSNDLQEAAALDGANRLQRMFLITLPCIKPMIIMMLVTNVSLTLIYLIVLPLGFLLLFPRFDLRKKGHTALWFATALLYPIGLGGLTLPFMYSGSKALVAFISLLIIVEPLQLIGALVLYLIARNLLRARA